MKKCDVGGQAIIEGVMMRGSKGLATAIRTPSGKIEVNVKKTKPITKKYKFLNIPIIRGAVVLIDSLIVGIKTLNYSASFFEEDEEESKFDIWLKEKLGDKGANDLLVTFTMMISLLVAAWAGSGKRLPRSPQLRICSWAIFRNSYGNCIFV